MRTFPMVGIAAVLLLAGCSTAPPNGTGTGSVAVEPTTPTAATAPTVTMTERALFVDRAADAGIRFTHDAGATGKFFYIENTPPGCAFLDFDSDGWLDLFLVQSGPSEPPETVTARPPCALYRNNRDGTFTNVTDGSGVEADIGYGQGVAVGDYDNDGFPDLLVTSYDRLHLFRNRGGTGKFLDVTRTMGMDTLRGYFTSAAFGDYDNDGKLDLYVCRYGPWDWKSNVPCRDNLGPDYCPPIVYEPDEHLLLRNEGTRFRDVSRSAGIHAAKGRGLGVVFLDFDRDGKQDIFVANDQTPNMLWRNRGDGTFSEVAVPAGCAYDAQGQVMAGMGVAVGDYDRSGNDSLYVGNFSDKPNMLFRNIGNGLFRDESYASGLALPHMPFLTFGTEFFDYDRDGWFDLLTVNGHVKVTVDRQSAMTTYRERKQLFRNEGNGRFTEVAEPGQLGSLGNATIGRGLAIGDYDNDGRPDALIANQNGPTELMRNETKNENRWVSFLPVGVKSNREGRHAQFVLRAGGETRT
ncbi:MAG: VCBS repeat-containing protein, partial [Capsulimonadales bacterium]|nr:VCBS repeat-containing protein [Capsulimonadales bacterium]